MKSLPIALVRSPRWVGIPLRLLPHQYTGAVGALPRHPTVLVVAVVLAVVVVLLAGAAPARATESVLVNVNADGDTPIAGGVVSASGCARGGDGRADAVGSPLRQSTGQLAEPTNAAGVALLQFDRLPRCLIVDAAGGQANGGTLHDSFRAEAHNETGDLMNVFVTPVSTLTYDAMRERPDLSEREATRVVERLLGIPSHFDDFDLAADDGPFDGDTYLAAASRAGGVDRLNAALLRTDRRRAFHGRHAVAADTDADLQKWWNDLDVTKMVKDGLKDFGLSILTGGLESGGKWVLGRLLDDWGLKEVKDFFLPKSDTQKIIEMLQELTIRVNNLQKTSDTILKEVLGTNFNTVLGPSIDLIAKVDAIQTSIANLLKLDDNDAGRVGATKDILAEIGAIVPSRNLFNTILTQTVPGGDNLLKAASKRAAVQDRWFTAEDVKSVTDVYDYFAIYQLRLANLLVEYWNTRSCTNTPVPPDCLSPKTIQLSLDKFDTAIDDQKDQLKPPLPPGTFVDRTTMRMWPTASWPLNGQEALNWTSQWVPKSCSIPARGAATCTGSSVSPFDVPRKTTGLSLPVFGTWTDWQFANEDDYKSLIDGWSGDSPLDWLHRNVGFATTTMSPENDKNRLSGHMWLGDSFRPGTLGLYVYRANLSEPDKPGPHIFFKRAAMPSAPCDTSASGRSCKENPASINYSDIRNNYTGQMLLWRQVTPGDYWWP